VYGLVVNALLALVALIAAAPAAGGGRTTVRRAQPGVHTVVLDPGHGGDEIGAAANGLLEKDSNLDMAFRVKALLEAHGVRVVMTRQNDSRAVAVPSGTQPGSFPLTRLDLQARVDLANTEHADLFLSLHSNGSASGAERGVEVWYDAQRPFAAQNQRLAQFVLDGVTARLDAAGHPGLSRGVKDDQCWRQFQGRCFSLFVLGPAREVRRPLGPGGQASPVGAGGQTGQAAPAVQSAAGGQDAQAGALTRPTEMPGALAELLFISSPADAALLESDAIRDVLAAGVADGVLTYLAEQDASQSRQDQAAPGSVR
jgi:N-acetylmuramoyl-L-alanine amidase